MSLDPRKVITFAVFAQHLSFTRAAALLHISQPALHMQVKQLEEEAGKALYRRVGQRLELTAAGRRVALLGRGFQEQLRRTQADLDDNAQDTPLRLCAGEGALLHLLPAGIRAYLARKLGPLRILTLERGAALKAISDGNAHLAVTSVESTPAAPLRWSPLAQVDQVLAVPRGHPLARRRSVRLDQLGKVPLILPPVGRPLRTAVNAVLPDAQVAVETQGWQVMLTCVAWGMGAAVVNAFNVPPRGVVLVPLKGLPVRRYGCVWHSALDGDERVAALREALTLMAPDATIRA